MIRGRTRKCIPVRLREDVRPHTPGWASASSGKQRDLVCNIGDGTNPVKEAMRMNGRVVKRCLR
jgi:hypothetical protein